MSRSERAQEELVNNAYSEGFSAGKDDEPQDPPMSHGLVYDQFLESDREGEIRKAWIEGWRDGKKE